MFLSNVQLKVVLHAVKADFTWTIQSSNLLKKKSKQVKDDFKTKHYGYTVQTMYDTQWCSQNFRQEIIGSLGTMSKVDL